MADPINLSSAPQASGGAIGPQTGLQMGTFNSLTNGSYVQLGQGGDFYKVDGSNLNPVGTSDADLLAKLQKGEIESTLLKPGNGYTIDGKNFFYGGASSFTAVKNGGELQSLQTSFMKNSGFNSTAQNAQVAKTIDKDGLDTLKTATEVRQMESNVAENEANGNVYRTIELEKIAIAKEQLQMQKDQQTWNGWLNVGKETLALGNMIGQSILQGKMIGLQDKLLDKQGIASDKAFAIKKLEIEQTAIIQEQAIAADVKKTKYAGATEVAKAKISAGVHKAKIKAAALQELFYARRSYNYGNYS